MIEVTGGFGSVAAEASWGLDRLQLGEVEVADFPQCICRCSVLEIVGQSLKPRGIVGLQRQQLGDGITPASCVAAVIGRAPGAGGGQAGGAGGTIARLALGIGQRLVADRLTRHVPLRSVTSRNAGDQARCLKRQLSLPVSMMSQ